MAGSDSPKISVRQRPRPRSLARAISGPRASTASVTARKSSSQLTESSCAVISHTGTSTVRQLASIVAKVPGMSLATVTWSSCSWVPLTTESSADCRAGTSSARTWSVISG